MKYTATGHSQLETLLRKSPRRPPADPFQETTGMRMEYGIMVRMNQKTIIVVSVDTATVISLEDLASGLGPKVKRKKIILKACTAAL